MLVPYLQLLDLPGAPPQYLFEHYNRLTESTVDPFGALHISASMKTEVWFVKGGT